MTEILKDFAPGPLDVYRKKASFNWKQLRILLNGIDGVKYEAELIEKIKTLPEFQENLHALTFDEERRLASRQFFLFRSHELFSFANKNPQQSRVIRNLIGILSPSASIKLGVSINMPTDVMRSLGTKRHQLFIEETLKGNIQGCFCLTEIGHGSNTKAMRTSATYDPNTKTFLMQTPDFEAAKCWAGGLGQSATYAIVYAQLYTQNKGYGLHTFYVPIRDPKTLLPYPGVIVADMGEKIGVNGIDNGVLIFDNYRIPREYLLNRAGDVTEDGQYVTPIKNNSQRYGINLGILSAGRVGITHVCAVYGSMALVIAIRYAGVRRQFGPDFKEEIPILEYQTHQIRLLPHLAATYAIQAFSTFLYGAYMNYTTDLKTGNNFDILPQLGAEIHAVSSASKPLSSWNSRDTFMNCREACGGHGYLKVAGIGRLRSDQEPNVTFEGENHVLIQQTGNWILKFWPNVLNGKIISTPLKSVDFLTDALQILEKNRFSARNVEEICHPKYIFEAYQWLICYLLKLTYQRYQTLIKTGVDQFKAKNDNQAFFAKKLSVAYIQHFVLQKFNEFIQKLADPNIKGVLSNLFSLYGVWSLEKFLPILYQGGFAQGDQPSVLIYGAIMHLCENLKNDAVALVDVLAPDDFVLNSVLGASDGQVYQRLQSAIFRSPYAQNRPSWWQEIVNWRNHIKCKL